MIARSWMVLLTLAFLISACGGILPFPTPEKLPDNITATTTVIQSPQITITIPPSQTPKPSPIPSSTPLPAGPFQPVLPEMELPPELTSILHASGDGTLWILSEQDILILRENTWELTLAEIPGVLAGIDQSGLIWVIKPDGSSISSWDGKIWNTYAEDSGWMPFEDYFYIIGPPILDQFGQVWITTSMDLRVFDGQGWVRYTPKGLGLSHPLEAEENVLPNLHLKYLESSQELWLGTCNWTGAGPIGGQGVLRYNGYSWQEIDPAISSGCTEVIVEDSNGGIWIGLDGDVWRYDSKTGKLDQFPAPQSPHGGSSFFNGAGAIGLDSENNPWADLLLCGGGGCGFGTILYHFYQGEWIKIIEEDFYYHDLVFDQSGMPWLLTPGGIYQIEDNQPELFLELPIIPNSSVINREGQVWFLVKQADEIQLWTMLPDITN